MGQRDGTLRPPQKANRARARQLKARTRPWSIPLSTRGIFPRPSILRLPPQSLILPIIGPGGCCRPDFPWKNVRPFAASVARLFWSTPGRPNANSRPTVLELIAICPQLSFPWHGKGAILA